jgi:hypothetical protein
MPYFFRWSPSCRISTNVDSSPAFSFAAKQHVLAGNQGIYRTTNNGTNPGLSFSGLTLDTRRTANSRRDYISTNDGTSHGLIQVN